MDSLKVIARLLDYPDAQVQAHSNELCAAVASSTELPSDLNNSLLALIDEIYSADLLDAQESYTHVFDYGRALSLLLFEHVHGESRDRGQAMVDLMALYRSHGFEINVRELPDYIPLYLEYLSHRPAVEARQGLADIAHILGLLCARLRQRGSQYAVLFEALILLSGEQLALDQLQQLAAAEKPDNTAEALDKIWEEEQVRFGAGDAHDSCDSKATSSASAINTPQPHTPSTPLHWVQNAQG
jgi:nitrate reductase delta subunit